MPNFPKKLTQKLEERVQGDSLRELRSYGNLVDFSSNDYLGFSKEGDIEKKAVGLVGKEAPKNGSTGSRLLTGNHGLHGNLEGYLSELYGLEGALLFNSGYDANLGFFSCVPQRGDVVFYDELVHASIRDGMQLGKATAYKFAHNSLSSLDERISWCRKKGFTGEYYVVTESVFSMDGDSPDLENLVAYCNKNNTHLVVDEAHALGVFGKGLVAGKGLEKSIFALIITFGKAMGCHGAAILGSRKLKSFLINFSRSLMYTTAMAPHNVALIWASFLYLNGKKGQEAIENLKARIAYFKESVTSLQLESRFLKSDAAIQIAIMENKGKAKKVSQKLRDAGFDVRAILPPTVPEGNERLRLCLHAFNTNEEITELLHTIKENYG